VILKFSWFLDGTPLCGSSFGGPKFWHTGLKGHLQEEALGKEFPGLLLGVHIRGF